MADETCEGCRFWRCSYELDADGRTPDGHGSLVTLKEFEERYDSEGGECRRYPPQVLRIHNGLASQFPDTFTDDWCGEFKARTPLRVVE
jgi:hypothetical protein